MSKEIEKSFILGNKYGMHARPASLLVKTATAFNSEIFVLKGDVKVNSKSIMEILMLAAEHGDELKVIAEGDDAHDAMVEIIKLFDSNFNE